MLATMAEAEDDEEEEGGGQDRTETEEVGEVSRLGVCAIYIFGRNSSPRRYSVVAPRSDELGKRAVYRWIYHTSQRDANGVEDDMVQLDLHNLGGQKGERKGRLIKARGSKVVENDRGQGQHGSSKFEGSRGLRDMLNKRRNEMSLSTK